MAGIKITFNEIADRLETILTSGGFNTNIGQLVERTNRIFNEAELPATSVYIQPFQVDENSGDSYKTIVNVTIAASMAYGVQTATDAALDMLEDIHAAIEKPINFSLPRDQRVLKIDWLGDQIDYPANIEKIVTAISTYSFKYVRDYGQN